MKKVLLVVSLISVLLLAGCNKNEEVNNNVNNVPEVVTDNQEQQENSNVKQNEEVSTKSIKKIDENSDLVYYLESGNKKLPQVNLNYDNIKNLNDNIKNLDTENVEVSTYTSNDIISIFVKTYPVAGDTFDADVYNIDVYTGNFINNEELLKVSKKTEKDVINRIVSYADSVVEKIKSWGDDTDYFKGLNMGIYTFGTLTKGENIDIYNLPMFINENGNISIVVKYHVPAGSGISMEIIEL